MSGTYEFVQLDVFTRTPLTGNLLVVFIDAR
jgi:predicted PhzF superfamily epimerase YddE/YHI9